MNRHSLTAVSDDVRAFHVATERPEPRTPTMLPAERVKQRAGYADEENQEFRDATTLVDQADAAIDKLYYAVGDLVEMGLDPSPLWNIVQAANMAKLGPDGKAIPHPTIPGKVGKPEGWQRPEPWLKAEVERQIRWADEQTFGDVDWVKYGDVLSVSVDS